MPSHQRGLSAIYLSMQLLIFSSLQADTEFDRFQQQQQQQASQFTQQQQHEFDLYQKELEQGFTQFQQIYQQEFKHFTATLTQQWAQPRLSSAHQWVSYHHQRQLRQTIDFDGASITLELQHYATLTAAQITQRLLQQLISALQTTEADAFKADTLAQRVEQRLVKDVKHLQQGQPGRRRILVTLLPGLASADALELSRMATQLISQASMQTTQAGRDGAAVLQMVVQLEDLLLATHISPQPYRAALSDPAFNPAWLRKANTESAPPTERFHPFLPLAEQSAAKEGLSAALILAIMETESSFNPMAKSHIPAYGLMQVVPRSAGRDATAYLFGKSKILAPSYLYNSDNNVTVGSAYLHVLNYRYMRFINDPLSRLYCTIAAYNTGPGNVAQAFGDSISIRKVASLINAMSPEQVYQTLLTQLPYEETQNYLRKVTTRMENYPTADADTSS